MTRQLKASGLKYSSGNVAIHPISSSTPYLSPKPVQVLSFTGSGPVLSRQASSHPHQVVLHPTREEVLIPDLGADKVWRLVNEGGRWETKDYVDMVPGGGPRHAVVLGERNA
jgi:6-phosphogluconolactonase (cycloisomerase 2 family)